MPAVFVNMFFGVERKNTGLHRPAEKDNYALVFPALVKPCLNQCLEVGSLIF
jgi:hypothetical protein